MISNLRSILIDRIIYKRLLNFSIPFSIKKIEGIKIGKFVTIDKYCSIGKYSYIGNFTTLTKSSIGNYCSIGPNVKIGLGEHNYKLASTCARVAEVSYFDLTQKECTIGHDVWIGTGAVILRGTHVGTGAVIGANAVVTKNIPPFAIAVGSPARIIKYRFSEEIISILENSKWWELSLENAKKRIKNIGI